MSQYVPPIAEMQFVMNELAGLCDVAALPGYGDATPDTVTAILEEAGKFATGVLDPLNSVGDREGATLLADGSVRTPPRRPPFVPRLSTVRPACWRSPTNRSDLRSAAWRF